MNETQLILLCFDCMEDTTHTVLIETGVCEKCGLVRPLPHTFSRIGE